jgi:type VI secretion system protein ImpG
VIPENDLLDYYRNEIAYLREQGGQFAARYPKVAQRLVLSSSESPDPHTELLLESFAFLTARVQRDIDSEFPAISGALLDSTCPNLVHVVPSLSVAQMTLDPAQGKVTAGLKIPKHTRMWAFASSGETCRFKTVWETQLWPISLSNVSVDDERILRLDFETTGGADLSELALEKLSFHLGGDLQLTMPLHELFVSALESIELIAGDGRVHVLDVQQIKQLGHSLDDIAVQQLRNEHHAY